MTFLYMNRFLFTHLNYFLQLSFPILYALNKLELSGMSQIPYVSTLALLPEIEMLCASILCFLPFYHPFPSSIVTCTN
jgi:hypothetical protein